jgi:protein-tyrosine-phosphatase/predicted ATP-grasp superfamily ATP-dependent carboligase
VATPVARSLARNGIRVFVATASADEGPVLSRSVHGNFALPDASEQPDDFDDRLLAVARSTNADMLVPCSDKALAAVARLYDRLVVLANPGCPPPDVVDRALDKSATLEAAAKLGISVPATYRLAEMSSLAQTMQRIEFPVIAKARSQARTGGYRIRYFENAAQLSAAIAADPGFSERYVLQRWVPGHGEGVAVLMHGGAATAVFQHRRLKEFPSAGGVSVLSESAAPEPVMTSQAIALLRDIGWEGVAQVEFRRDGLGTPWLMEVNGRYWGSLTTALAAGVDFPYYHWQVSHGVKPSIPNEYAIGVRVRWTRGSILRFRERAFESDGPRGVRSSASAEFASFKSDFAPGVRSALWSPSDPLPALMDAPPALGKLAVSVIRAAGKSMLPRPLRRAYRRFGPEGALAYALLLLNCRLNPRRDAITSSTRPSSVLFVCSGNIMRSPLAAAAFAASLRASGDGSIAVDSCGLHADDGTRADPRAIRAAEAIGLDLRQHRAKRMTQTLADGADAIVVMERFQEFEMAHAYPNSAQKIYLLGYCAPGLSRAEMPDPYLADEAEAARILGVVAERAGSLARALRR